MPDILVFVARMSQYTRDIFTKNKSECVRLLKKCVNTMEEFPSKEGIKYVKLDPDNIEVVFTVDGAMRSILISTLISLLLPCYAIRSPR